MYRSHTCGELRLENKDKKVILCGWVNSIREHGNVVFIDLLDRYGYTQLVFDGDNFKIEELRKRIKKDFVLQVHGIVKERPIKNNKIATGEIEVYVSEYSILSKSKPLPIDIHNPKIETTEENRLKYRYIDLRKKDRQNNLIIRHRIKKAIHDFFYEHGFINIETPILAKSTPEGARDYLVPSRINKGKFYALPQSPQLFKQLLMISGFDRYYQIARCFRDEDLRADRQPEFTQLDIEMSFVEVEDIIDINERFLVYLFKRVLGVEIKRPFRRLSYWDAIERYGSDKPDLRLDLELKDVSNLFNRSGIDFMKDKHVKCIVINDKDRKINKKRIRRYENLVKSCKAKGLSYIMYRDKIEGNIAKFINEDLLKELNLKENDIMFIVGDENRSIVNISLSELRNRLGKDLGLIDEDKWVFCWVLDFPMFEWNEEEKKWNTMHHPFSMPIKEDFPKIDRFLKEKDGKLLEDIKAYAYDITLNGSEIGGGSIRIHDFELQKKIFKILKLTEEDINNKFGFFVKALEYGVPPHGGIAYGLDRLVALMCKEQSIREVIAFPKNKDAEDLMLNAPSEVSKEQLDELGIAIKDN